MQVWPLIGFVGLAAMASAAFSFASRWLALRTGAVAEPSGGRRIHRNRIPQLGGLGIGLTIGVFFMALAMGPWFPGRQIPSAQIFGFMFGVLVLMIGGFLDDRRHLRPSRLAWFPALACLSVVLSGTSVHLISQPGGHGAYSFVWRQWPFRIMGQAFHFTWPADALTFVWLLGMTAATKFADGLDGLVTGQAIIGAGLMTALTLTAAYYQPSVAVLALIVAAAFLGFLPWNMFPAKQFLGEAGSTIAGFSLAFLAIVSGAKLATALMAVGIPFVDILVVFLGRWRRGKPLFQGDNTHLHFKLLQLGLSQRQTVGLLWLLSLLFGLAALGLQTRGKIILLFGIFVVTGLLSVGSGLIHRRRSN